MKKLILIAIASLAYMGAHAQTQTITQWTYAPQTLSCTEEAISLKASIRSGWHVNSFQVGNMGPVNNSFEFTPSKLYTTTRAIVTEPIQLYKLEKMYNPDAMYFERGIMLKQDMTWQLPKTTNVLDKLSYIPWGDKKYLPVTNVDLSAIK